MSRHVCLLLLSLSAISVVLSLASSDDQSGASYGGRIVSGGWAYTTTVAEGVLASQSPVTGLAFGPGRNEVAFCAAVDRGGSALWLTEASTPDAYRDLRDGPITPSRLLWTAPAGITLRGPVGWSPNGALIALLACRENVSDLIVVDYATKEAVWITHDAHVSNAAWNPNADHIAYVNDEPGKAAVLLETFPPGDAKRIGGGGINLRWSVDGKALRWMEPTSETAWTEMIYETASAQVKPGNALPPRPANAKWSPDGRFCAYLTEAPGTGAQQLIICQTEATSSDPIPLPGLSLKELLGWSPESNLALVLDEKGGLYAVTARLPDKGLMAIYPRGYTGLRATGVAVDATAIGPPSWSSSGDFLSYVKAGENDREVVAKRARFPRLQEPFGKLVVMQFKREYLGPSPKAEREQIVFNMKMVATALQMYLSDYGRFPPIDDSHSMRDVLGRYVHDPSIYLRPGSEDEVIVKYLFPPGVSIEDALQGREPEDVPVAIVEYPTYSVIACADGHVDTVERK
jgi:hypothetical protein